MENEQDNTQKNEAIKTPLRTDAFELSDDEKIKSIAFHFGKIMETLGLDLTNDSLKGTPNRVAKMYVQDLFKGLHPDAKPNASVFDNRYGYDKMLIETNIRVTSVCEHHFLPMIGKAHVGYISSGKVIGLSKMNRIVEYFSTRPQVQERLALQIYNELKDILKTDSIMVVIDAEHLCVTCRGIKHENSSTLTVEYGGAFKKNKTRKEFYQLLDRSTNNDQK